MNIRMRLTFLISAPALLLATAFAGVHAADVPREIAGFALGTPISQYESRLRMQTALPIRYRECFEEVEIKETPGFKSGLIAYGTCAKPGHILRIKLKYSDYSKRFYDRLLAEFREKFGEPDKWRGDPFQVLIAWKWGFNDPEIGRISMILQHNTKDEHQKIGNSIKLTAHDMMDEEIACFRENRDRYPDRGEKKKSRKPPLEALIPE